MRAAAQGGKAATKGKHQLKGLKNRPFFQEGVHTTAYGFPLQQIPENPGTVFGEIRFIGQFIEARHFTARRLTHQYHHAATNDRAAGPVKDLLQHFGIADGLQVFNLLHVDGILQGHKAAKLGQGNKQAGRPRIENPTKSG